MQGMNLRATGATSRDRVEAVVQTLATVHSPGNSPAELAHDARNMVTALALYCDLLEEPGVLSSSFLHYGSELRLVVSASRRLVEKLVLLDSRESTAANGPEGAASGLDRSKNGRDGSGLTNAGFSGKSSEKHPDEMINDLGREILSNRNLLDAMAGLAISVTVEADDKALPVTLTSENLTRVLVNLVKNAAEAMRTAGSIRISLREREDGGPAAATWAVLTVKDTGPGIPKDILETIFEPGFTTRRTRIEAMESATGTWMAGHRGLGLSISRSIIEAAGGHIGAQSGERGGAQITIELPVRAR